MPAPLVARNDTYTVAAIALAAMCLVTCAHEALGHGGVCLGIGGRIVELTSAVFRCDRPSPWIAAAGPAGNFAAGTLALLAMRWLRPRRPDLRLFLLLIAGFSFFWESGYAVHAMHRRDGDLYFAGMDLFGEPSFGWRLTAALLGAVLFFATTIGISRALAAQWPDLREARRVARIAWLAAAAGAVLATLPFTLVHTGAEAWGDLRDAGLEIGVSAIPLLLLPWRAPAAAGAADGAAPGADEIAAPGAARYIARSLATRAVGVLVYGVFVATLGRGIGA